MKKQKNYQKFWQIRKALRGLKRLSKKKWRIVHAKSYIRSIVLENIQIYKDNGFNPPNTTSIYRPIFVPENLSIWNNYDKTVQVFKDIKQFGLKDRRPIIIHLDKLVNIDPSSALVLVSEIYRCKNLRKYRNRDFVTGTYPRNKDAHRLLAEMGFFNLLDMMDAISGDGDNNNQELYWKFETYNNVDAEFIDWFVSLIEKYVVAMDARARAHLVAAIKEAMQNTLDHAYLHPTIYPTMDRRWFLSMSLNPIEHEVRIMLYDQGVGIPATLPTTTLETIRTLLAAVVPMGPSSNDGEIIRLATHKYRTRMDQSGRGRGFYDMKKFVEQCSDGELRIRSNRGFYTYINKTETVGDNAASVGGTVVEFRFKSADLVQMDDG